MGKIGKMKQLNKKMQYRAIRDLSFYEMRWIWKFSFKHCLMKEIKIFKIWIKWAYTVFLISLLRLIFTF